MPTGVPLKTRQVNYRSVGRMHVVMRVQLRMLLFVVTVNNIAVVVIFVDIIVVVIICCQRFTASYRYRFNFLQVNRRDGSDEEEAVSAE